MSICHMSTTGAFFFSGCGKCSWLCMRAKYECKAWIQEVRYWPHLGGGGGGEMESKTICKFWFSRTRAL